MRSFTGAQTVGPGHLYPVLLLSSTLVSGGRWACTYSVAPGVTVTVVTEAGPGAADPADSVYAQIATELTRGT